MGWPPTKSAAAFSARATSATSAGPSSRSGAGVSPRPTARAAEATSELFDLGVTFTVYTERDAIDRILPFDIIPRVISADEWRTVNSGVVQRVKARTRLDGELIEREMAHLERQRPIELGQPVRLRLTGARIDQIDADPREVTHGDIESANGLGSVVPTAEKAQCPVVERLDAERHAVHPGLGEGCEPAGLDRGGIGLQRDLGFVVDGEEGARTVDDRGAP